DPARWPVPQRVDHHIVRAEMNGLDFDHRVLRPWANDPAFYVTVFASESDQPAREGHYARGSLELWSYAWPLDAASAADIRLRLPGVPAAARPGAAQPGGERAGPVDPRRAARPRSSRLPRTARCAADRSDASRAASRRRGGPRGDRVLHQLARGGGVVEERA